MSRIFSYFVFLGCLVTGLPSCDSKKADNQQTEANTSPKTTISQPEAKSAQKTILFFGNSLTAGYGLEPAQAFPALVGQKMDSLGYDYQVINAGLSGETSAGGRNRIGWVLRQPVDVFVLELGANDGLRGLSLDATKLNLQGIIDSVRAKSPQAQIVLAGMEIPPNMGAAYTKQFREMYKDLAKENNLVLIPFLLEGVGGVARLNQEDGIHPTAEGHRIVTDNVWKVLEPVLKGHQGN